MLSRGDRFHLHQSSASRAFVLAVKVIFVRASEFHEKEMIYKEDSNPVFDGDHSVSHWETDRMFSVRVKVRRY